MNYSSDGDLSVPKGRIHSLDFIRGVAVLAMLVANVPWHVGSSMSRVHEADPTSVTAWLFQYLFIDQRFMPLFCMLFGASIILLNKSAAISGKFCRYFLWRMFLLLVIGVLHAYLLWPGDILITYALCGPFLLLFYRSSVKTLLIVGIAFKAIDLAFGEWPFLYDNTIKYVLFSWWVDYGEAPFTAFQAYHGSYIDLLQFNAWRCQFLQWTAMPYFRMWNALGFMLVGMAFFKMGMLQGQMPRAVYGKMTRVALLVGTPLVLYGVFARIGINPTVGEYLGFSRELPLRNLTFRTGCAILSCSVLGLMHLVIPYLSNTIKAALESVGRMALTNYIFQSVFFLILVHGLDLITFDSLDHDVMLVLVAIAWMLQLLLSSIWMRYIAQGPIEMIWRRASRLMK